MGIQLHIMYSFTVGLLSSVIANYVYIMRPLQTHICTYIQNIRYLIIVISDALLWHESFDSIVQYSLKYRTSYLSHLRRTIQIIFAENRGKKLQTDLLVSEFGSDRKVQPASVFSQARFPIFNLTRFVVFSSLLGCGLTSSRSRQLQYDPIQLL